MTVRVIILEKYIQHTIQPTIVEFSECFTEEVEIYTSREGLDGLLDIFQVYKSIIIIKSKN